MRGWLRRLLVQDKWRLVLKTATGWARMKDLSSWLADIIRQLNIAERAPEHLKN
jgi:hypothetical protein